MALHPEMVEGSWGIWAKDLRERQHDIRSVHVLTGVPPIAKAREGFAAISGSVICAWPLRLAGSELLPAGAEEVILPPFSDRPSDKAAHVISAAWTVLEAVQDSDERKEAVALFHQLDIGALVGIFIDPAKIQNISRARDSGERLASTIALRKSTRVWTSIVKRLNHIERLIDRFQLSSATLNVWPGVVKSRDALMDGAPIASRSWLSMVRSST